MFLQGFFTFRLTTVCFHWM